MKMTKATKDKIKSDITVAKGGRVKIETLLPVKWKKKLVANIQPKERKL